MDVLDLWRGNLTWRRLRVLIEHLPAESALARGQAPDAAPWSLTNHLLASVAERIDWNTYVTTKLGVDPKEAGRIREPEPIERPGVTKAKAPMGSIRVGGRHGSGAEQLAGLFGAPANA